MFKTISVYIICGFFSPSGSAIPQKGVQSSQVGPGSRSQGVRQHHEDPEGQRIRTRRHWQRGQASRSEVLCDPVSDQPEQYFSLTSCSLFVYPRDLLLQCIARASP